MAGWASGTGFGDADRAAGAVASTDVAGEGAAAVAEGLAGTATGVGEAAGKVKVAAGAGALAVATGAGTDPSGATGPAARGVAVGCGWSSKFR
ncbi:MAG: hypothetical protein KGL48_15365 [Sphingomonadales bacterium]|nr:hypothetical protein [Sphingomonadales bacterium]